MKRTRTIALATGITAGAAVALSACGATSGSSANKADQSNSAQQLATYEISQPIPKSDWSQYRETLINVEQAMIKGVATTTFFYNMGSNVPIKSCPSIGFPVSSTSQLTNPLASEQHGQYGDGTVVVGQQEPNGVYTGDSTGTYVVCVEPNGTKQIDYWEGNVETEGGNASLQGGLIVSSNSTVTTKVHK